VDSILTLPFAFPGIPGVRCLFTTRRGGGSLAPFAAANLSFDVGDDPDAVLANRRLLHRDAGFETWAENQQVHGDALRFDPPDSGLETPGEAEADGLATAEPGRALVVKTADCQPVMLADRKGRAAAALHVGWRGNKAGVPEAGARTFCARYGLDPAEVCAVRGPSLGPAAAQFVNFETDFGPGFEAYFDPATRTVDLWRLTRDQLLAAGLRGENLYALDLCTHSLPELFFSYRRERTTGRQAALIWLE
jgi:hypothetical protein